jgi:serine/threonine-protein kinase
MHAILFELPMPAVLRQPDLPGPVLNILRRALAKDREERYPDCLAFQADLEEYILSTGKPVTTQHIAQLIAQVSLPGHDAPLPPLPPGSPPLTDTALRSVPAQGLAPADPLAATVPTQGTGRLRAALAAGVVLLVSGGGYLLWGGAGPVQPVLTAEAPAVPSPPAAPTAPAVPEPPAEPALPSGTAPAEAPTPPAPGELRANHDAKMGTLEFEVRPSAVVYIEGKRLGLAPPLGVVYINPGTYRMKFANKKLRKTVERPVEVKAGQTTFIQVDLLHEEKAQTP